LFSVVLNWSGGFRESVEEINW